ncbi:MAG: SDR family oxidoreductase, partial [Planctomycetales bacterium]
GNLNDAESCRALATGCDAIVHAALERPGRTFRGGEGDPVEFAQTNLIGSLRLMEAARAADVGRFVFISTCAVHEKSLDDRPLDETHPLWPMSHYGAYMASVEKFIHSYGFGDGWPVCALRPTGVYGVKRPARKSKWYPLIRSVVRGEDAKCSGGGKEVHAADVAQAVEILLAAEVIAGEAYSCCDRYVSAFEVAQLAKRISGSSSKIIGEPKSPKHQIETGKLQALGMKFGGLSLLESTVRELVDAAK